MVTELSNSKNWWHKTTPYWVTGSCDPNYNWIRVNEFYNIINNSNTTGGLYGVVYNGDLRYAEVGDVIQMRRDSTRTWGHSVVVSSVTATYGNQSLNTIFVAGHSTNELDTPLSNRDGYDSSVSNLRLIKIMTRY